MMSSQLPAGTNWPASFIAQPVGVCIQLFTRQDPEGRDEGADRDHQGRGEVQPLADLVHPEQHHAEEAGLEEEGGQHLIGHERADDRPGPVGEDRPVGAELVGHDDAGDDAHREGDREDLQPVAEQVEIGVLARLQPQRLEHREIGSEPDREGREDEVERDRERELDSRQDQCGFGVCHSGFAPRTGHLDDSRVEIIRKRRLRRAIRQVGHAALGVRLGLRQAPWRCLRA